MLNYAIPVDIENISITNNILGGRNDKLSMATNSVDSIQFLVGK